MALGSPSHRLPWRRAWCLWGGPINSAWPLPSGFAGRPPRRWTQGLVHGRLSFSRHPALKVCCVPGPVPGSKGMGTAGCFRETRPPVDGRPGAGCRGAGTHRTVMVWDPPEWSEWAGEGRCAPDCCCRGSTILKAQVLLCPSFPASQLPLHPRSLSILYPSLPVSSSSCLPVTGLPLSSVPQSPYSSAPCHPNSSASSFPFLHH